MMTNRDFLYGKKIGDQSEQWRVGHKPNYEPPLELKYFEFKLHTDFPPCLGKHVKRALPGPSIVNASMVEKLVVSSRATAAIFFRFPRLTPPRSRTFRLPHTSYRLTRWHWTKNSVRKFLKLVPGNTCFWISLTSVWNKYLSLRISIHVQGFYRDVFFTFTVYEYIMNGQSSVKICAKQQFLEAYTEFVSTIFYFLLT